MIITGSILIALNERHKSDRFMIQSKCVYPCIMNIVKKVCFILIATYYFPFRENPSHPFLGLLSQVSNVTKITLLMINFMKKCHTKWDM